jgi:hypothetical protein
MLGVVGADGLTQRTGAADVADDVHFAYEIVEGPIPAGRIVIGFVSESVLTPVYVADLPDLGIGRHSVTWPRTRWNLGESNGAYVNPRHGRLVAALEVPGQSPEPAFVCLRLRVTCSVTDPKPSEEEISSGVAVPDEVLVGLKDKDGNVLYGPKAKQALKPHHEDLDNDGKLEVSELEISQEFDPVIPDGEYHVVLQGRYGKELHSIRDVAGNVTEGCDSDGTMRDWRIWFR